MEKLRLLIADDEPRIVNLIKSLIRFDALSLQLVDVAYDGETCLAQIKTHHPDIVITDIRMPGMTGLELMKACKEQALSPSFIIISGFTQFDYAYSAIKYGVEDFLLKPIGEEELHETLSRVIKRRGHPSLPSDETSPPKETGVSELSHALLYTLLTQEISPSDCTPAYIEKYFGIRFAQNRWLVGCICLDQEQPGGAYLHHLLDAAIKRLQTQVHPLCTSIFHLPQNAELYFLLNYAADQEVLLLRKLQMTLESIHETLHPYPFITPTMSVWEGISSIQMLSHAFSDIRQLSKSRYLLGMGSLLRMSMLAMPLTEMPAYPVDVKNRLMDGLKTLEPAKGRKLLHALFLERMPDIGNSPYLYFEHALQLGTLFLTCLDLITPLSNGYAQELKQLTLHLQSAPGEQALLTRLLDSAEALLFEAQQTYATSENRVIHAVKAYVQEHYHERLELEDVAGHVYLNPAYVGTFFKRETGMNFSEYLTGIRIEKAMRLLEDMQYNINEVAGKVGYKDPHYFSRLFQKQVGVKPAEYRKLRQKQRAFR